MAHDAQQHPRAWALASRALVALLLGDCINHACGSRMAVTWGVRTQSKVVVHTSDQQVVLDWCYFVLFGVCVSGRVISTSRIVRGFELFVDPMSIKNPARKAHGPVVCAPSKWPHCGASPPHGTIWKCTAHAWFPWHSTDDLKTTHTVTQCNRRKHLCKFVCCKAIFELKGCCLEANKRGTYEVDDERGLHETATETRQQQCVCLQLKRSQCVSEVLAEVAALRVAGCCWSKVQGQFSEAVSHCSKKLK